MAPHRTEQIEARETEREGCLALAVAFPDSRGNAESIGPLRAGKARACMKGVLPRFEEAVVQRAELPEEPVAFGTDPKARQ
jgi:hypothetical protein